MFLSVDIGGSYTRIAISKDGKKILQKIKFQTPKKYDDGIDLIQEKIESLTEGNIPKVITVCAASSIDYEKGILIRPPALPNWAGHLLGKELELRLKTNVRLENDAALAALGEAHVKTRKKYRVLAYVTLSTGLGGARVTDGKIDYSTKSFEAGHQILDPNGRYWPGCGQKGCFEALCSGRAFEMTYGVKPEFCEDTRIWKEHAELTSQGLINVITIWSPDILVIGGSLTKAGKKFSEPLIKFVNERLKIFPAPKIEISKLDDNNGLLGGFIYQISKSG